MTLWFDNQLPPALPLWMQSELFVDCRTVRELHLQRASDLEIFTAARAARAVVITKDADFVELLERQGAPPQIVLITCGNTSNAHLRRLVEAAWPTVRAMLDRGEALIELGDHPFHGS